MLNAILILLGTLGAFLLVSSLFGFFKTKERLVRSDGETLRELDLQGKLATLLHQAHAPLKVSEFLMISAAIGAALALAAFLVTGGLMLSLVLLIGGGFIYYLYLLERRDKLILVYEDAMPQVIVIIREYLRVHGSDLVGAIQEVVNEGPEVVASDFRTLAAAFRLSGSVDIEAVNEVLTYRNSPSLSKIVELLLLYRGTNISSLSEALENLQVTIDEEVDIAAENASVVYGPKRNLLMICGIVLAVTMLMVSWSPIFRAFFGTLPGQFTLLTAIGITVGMYYLGSRAAARASMTRPYAIKYPEKRSASAVMPVSGTAAEERAKEDEHGIG
jgi:Flp pilus assembly protein TadB